MGFEVLNSRGQVSSGQVSGQADDAPPTAVDVVALDAPPQSTVTTPPTGRRATARGAAVVVLSLVAGAVLGGYVVSRHEANQQRQVQAAALAANATIIDVSPSTANGRTVMNLTATVSNQGPLPITVVTTSSGGVSGTRVSVVGSSPVVQPGASSQVTMHLHVACDEPGNEQTAHLSVRTADRREHRLPLGSGVRAMRLLDACNANKEGPVQASVVGPITRPMLLLTNDSNVDLQFTLSGAIGPAEFNGPIITVSTLPAMPVRVRAGTSLDVQLLVRARRCLGDISVVSGSSYLNVDSSASSTNVDIAALVGAAVARACAKR